MPSVEAYAVAIVTAARLTGEDPLSIADESPKTRFRHFALHALLQVYPDAERTAVSKALGCPGKPSFFHRSSMWHVLGDGPHRQTPVEWWSNETLAETINAVMKVTRPAMVAAAKAAPQLAPTEPPRTPSCAKLITPKPVEAPVQRLQEFSSKFGRPPLDPNADPLTRRAVERGKSFDLLAEAAANTKKLQDAMPKERDGD